MDHHFSETGLGLGTGRNGHIHTSVKLGNTSLKDLASRVRCINFDKIYNRIGSGAALQCL